MLNNPISRTFVLAGACLLVVIPFFWWGIPSGHDFEFHMFSWMDVLGQWKHGIVYPRWAALAHWGYGEARFLFYPPASWTLGAMLGAVLPWKLVPGAYCWIVLALAGASMYRLAREWLAPRDAQFAAIFYALNPYHLLIVYWRSAYAELLAASLLPPLLLCLLRIFSPEPESDFRPTLWLSLTLAAAWLTNAPAAIMIHYSAAGLALLLAAREATRNSWGPRVWRPVNRTAGAMLLGAGLASFYLLPTIYEQHWINLDQVMAPGVRPQDNFLFTTIADPDHNRFNLLVSTVALVEIVALSLAISFSKKKQVGRDAFVVRQGTLSATGPTSNPTQSPWTPLAAWGTASVILMLSISNLLWQHLPKFRFVQLPFRLLLCLNAALAMLLTVAFRRWTLRLLACSLLLVAVIIAGYRIQAPWWDTAADIREMSDAVADGSGYEGTDEYVPAGADAYELKKDLARVSDDSGAPIANQMLAWSQTEKHFRIHTASPQDITVRLFNYPAWSVVVNGKLAETQSAEVTGLIVIPVPAGDSDVYIYFRRTNDRLIGDFVSLISLLVFLAAWIRSRTRVNTQSSKIASTAA